MLLSTLINLFKNGINKIRHNMTIIIDICMFYNEKWENLKEYYDSRIEEYEINLENRKKIIVKDYIYDMHTREGKRMGKDKKNFREEGCIVMNEDEEFLRK